jgi:hypothetical protein
LRTSTPLDDFIRRIPKAELHIHIGGGGLAPGAASFLTDGDRRRFLDEIDATATAAAPPSPGVTSPRG